MRRFLAVVIIVLTSNSAFSACHDLLNFSATKLRSTEMVDFCAAFEGKALLVVNTASQCGYTPQFKGLEALHQKYGEQLAIVGFPSDDFNQEYTDTEKISDVCYVNYGVTFTMLEPSSVKGQNANQVFKMVTERTGQQPAWNFNKYLISADGSQVEYFPSNVAPDNKGFISEIETMLSASK